MLVNYDREPRPVTVAGFDGNGSGGVKVYQPFAEAREGKLPATVKLAGERFAVVIEQ